MTRIALLLIASLSMLSGCIAYDTPGYNDGYHGDRDRDGMHQRGNRDRDGDGVRNRDDRRPDDPRRY